MSMLNHTSSTVITTGAIRSTFRSWRDRLAGTINGYIAAVIAHRERQAHIFMLKYFTDRELGDIGLYRSQIPDGLAEAAKDRSALQEVRQRQSMMS